MNNRTRARGLLVGFFFAFFGVSGGAHAAMPVDQTVRLENFSVAMTFNQLGVIAGKRGVRRCGRLHKTSIKETCWISIETPDVSVMAEKSVDGRTQAMQVVRYLPITTSYREVLAQLGRKYRRFGKSRYYKGTHIWGCYREACNSPSAGQNRTTIHAPLRKVAGRWKLTLIWIDLAVAAKVGSR